MTVGTASSTLKRSTFSHTWEDIGVNKNEAVGRWLYWKIDINIINSSRKTIEPHLSCVNENKIFIKVSIKVQFKVSLFHRFNQSSILGFFFDVYRIRNFSPAGMNESKTNVPKFKFSAIRNNCPIKYGVVAFKFH